MAAKICLCILAAIFCLSSAAPDFKRTIIAIEKPTGVGEYMFLRGGSDRGRSIPIKHNIHPEDSTSFYAQTSKGDDKLEWGSSQSGQGVYRYGHITRMAEGTPMLWTTNDTNHGETVEKDGAGYWEMNTGGPHFWVLDVDMDCSAVPGGWFAFKGYMIDLNGYTPGWEGNDIRQDSCQINGTYVHIPGAQSWNHYGACGSFNIVKWREGDCMSQEVSVVEDIVERMNAPAPVEVVEEYYN